MFDQNNRVKITIGILLGVYSLGLTQGAIKSKINHHFEKEDETRAVVDGLVAKVETHDIKFDKLSKTHPEIIGF